MFSWQFPFSIYVSELTWNHHYQVQQLFILFFSDLTSASGRCPFYEVSTSEGFHFNTNTTPLNKKKNFLGKLWERKNDGNSNDERLLFKFIQLTKIYFANTSPIGHSRELFKQVPSPGGHCKLFSRMSYKWSCGVATV